MAWVQTINPEVATARLREVYDRIRQRKGNVPNFINRVLDGLGVDPEPSMRYPNEAKSGE